MGKLLRISNEFFSEAAEPNLLKFHMGPPQPAVHAFLMLSPAMVVAIFFQ